MHKTLRSSSLTHAKKADRDKSRQGRNTPGVIVPAICGTLGGPPDLDPCSNATSVVPARTRIFLAENVPRGDGPVDYATVIGDGTLENWQLFGWGRPLTVFVNPPWDDLAVWLPLLEHWAAAGVEIVALIPLRSHRRYWGPVWRANAVCFVEALAFEGWDNKIATPCVAVYWGRALQRFRKHFTPWGHVLTLNRGKPRLDRMPLPTVAESSPHPRLQLLASLVKRVEPEVLLDAVLEGFEGITFGDVMTLIDDLETHHGPEAAEPLQRMIESMPMALSGANVKAAPDKKRTKKKSPTNKPAKKATRRASPTDAGGPRSRKKTAKKKAPKKRTPKKPGTIPTRAEASHENGKAVTPSSTAELDGKVEEKYLRGNKAPIKTTEVADAFGVSKATALRSLQRLTEAGKARLEGTGRSAAYRSMLP